MENKEQRNGGKGDLYSLFNVSSSEIEGQTNIVRLLNVMDQWTIVSSFHPSEKAQPFDGKQHLWEVHTEEEAPMDGGQ